MNSKIDGRKDFWTDSQTAKKAGVGVGTVARYNRVMNSDDEVLLDLLESNIRRRGEIGGSAKKVGKRIKELERLYGIREGSAGGNGSNQYIKKELEPNSSVEAKKSQSDLAAQMGISVDTLQNYKMLAENKILRLLCRREFCISGIFIRLMGWFINI